MKKVLGYGALIWVVVYLLVMLLYAYHAYGALWSRAITIIAAAAIAGWAGRKVGEFSIGPMFGVALGWVVVGLVLDLIFTIPYSGFGLYAMWDYWAGYCAVLIAPLITFKKSAV